MHTFFLSFPHLKGLYFWPNTPIGFRCKPDPEIRSMISYACQIINIWEGFLLRKTHTYCLAECAHAKIYKYTTKLVIQATLAIKSVYRRYIPLNVFTLHSL